MRPRYLSIFLAWKLDVIQRNLNAIEFVCVREVTRKRSVHKRRRVIELDSWGFLKNLAVDMTPTQPSHPSISARSHCAVRAHQYTVPLASPLSQGTFWVLLCSLSLLPHVCGEGMQKWVAACFLRLPVYFRNLNERRVGGRPRTIR